MKMSEVKTIYKVCVEMKDRDYFELLYADFESAYSYWNGLINNDNSIRLTVWKVENQPNSPVMEDMECLAEYDVNGFYYYDVG